MKDMELIEIETRLLHPETGPVDVEFEHYLLSLFSALRALGQPGGSDNYDVQKQFCQELRNSKMIFDNKISHFYGARYRGDTGGQILIDMAEKGVEILRANPRTESKVLASVSRHRDEIVEANTTLVRKSIVALEAPVPA